MKKIFLDLLVIKLDDYNSCASSIKFEELVHSALNILEAEYEVETDEEFCIK